MTAMGGMATVLPWLDTARSFLSDGVLDLPPLPFPPTDDMPSSRLVLNDLACLSKVLKATDPREPNEANPIFMLTSVVKASKRLSPEMSVSEVQAKIKMLDETLTYLALPPISPRQDLLGYWYLIQITKTPLLAGTGRIKEAWDVATRAIRYASQSRDYDVLSEWYYRRASLLQHFADGMDCGLTTEPFPHSLLDQCCLDAEQAIQIAKAHGNKNGDMYNGILSRCLMTRSRLAMMQKQLHIASRYQEEALEIADIDDVPTTAADLATILLRLRHVSRAVVVAEKGKDAALALGELISPQNHKASYLLLATALKSHGRSKEALPWVKKASSYISSSSHHTGLKRSILLLESNIYEDLELEDELVCVEATLKEKYGEFWHHDSGQASRRVMFRMVGSLEGWPGYWRDFLTKSINLLQYEWYDEAGKEESSVRHRQLELLTRMNALGNGGGGGFDLREMSRIQQELEEISKDNREQCQEIIKMIREQKEATARMSSGGSTGGKKEEEDDEKKGQEEKKEEGEDECQVCLMHTEAGERVQVGCCMKYYHEDCLTLWANSCVVKNHVVSCPNCRGQYTL